MARSGLKERRIRMGFLDDYLDWLTDFGDTEEEKEENEDET